MRLIRRADARLGLGLMTIALGVAGCDAPMEIFSSASDAAARVTYLTWFMIILSVVVYAIVMVAMFVAMSRNRHRAVDSVDLADHGVRSIVICGMILPALILGAIFVVASSALGKYPDPKSPLTIRVTGHQWWWELDYQLATLDQHFKAANEIHIPVGQPVRLVVTSADVIHSFWVPQLQGKIDMIPGDTNVLRLQARQPGTYTGQCAEFCGAQHAKMGFTVVADDSATFAGWLRSQLADGEQPSDSTTLNGQRLFVSGPCALCHTVRGTPASGSVAPDLTHVASRTRIAAGTLPNTLGSLEGWIANAQSLKPGAKMPVITQYNGLQLREIATYVASLK